MSVVLVLNQSSASLRNVPLPPLVQSNGTSACTNESGRTFFFELGGVDYGSGGSLSVISANAGLYTCNFSASKISLTGQGSVYYSSGTALPARTPIEIVKIDSMNSQDFGVAAFSEVSIHAGTHSNVTIKGVQNAIIADGTYSAVSVRVQAGDYGSITTFGVSKILPGTYSGVTVGAGDIKPGSYSGVSVGVLDIKPASYSGVTVGIDNIKAASYSGVTIQGVSNTVNFPGGSSNASSPAEIADYVWLSYATRTITSTSTATILRVVEVTSGVTLKANTHSGATIQGVSNLSSGADLVTDIWAPAAHSGVTIDGVARINSGVTLNANTHSGATIQGLSNYANISNVTLAAGTHSGATIQGLSRINSSVTIANATYSAVTLRLDAVDYSSIVTVGVGKIAPASYSGVSFEIKAGGIQAASFGAGAVDAGALATDAGQEIADRILNRNIASGSDGGRDVRQALYTLRNRVLMSGSTGTVYQTDDSTSAWTFSIATVVAVAINELDPGGT
jgi:hypothetical protein